jgi:hypothetical protein
MQPRIDLRIVAIAAMHAVLCILAITLPIGSRSWGFDAWTAIPDPTLAALLAALPLAAALLLHVPRIAALAGRRGATVGLLLLSAAGLLAIAIHTLAQGGVPPLLGDGSLYRSEVLRMLLDADHAPTFVKPSAMLTGYILLAIVRIVQPTDPTLPFLLLSAVSLLGVAIRFVLLARRQGAVRTLLLLTAVAATPAWLLFCGSIELYTPALAATIWLLVELLLHLRGEASGPVPLIAAALTSVALSLSTLALLVPTAYVLWLRWRPRETTPAPLRAALVLIGACVLLLAAAVLLAPELLQPYILSLTGVRYTDADIDYGIVAYSILHPAHLLDVANMLVLAGGAWLPLGGAVLLVRRWRAAIPPEVASFALVAASSALLHLLVAHAALGMARDWDLMILPALLVPAAGAALLMSAEDAGLRRVLAMLVLAQGVQVAGWITPHVDASAASARVLRLVDMDAGLVRPDFTYFGYENLRKQYRTAHDDAGVFAMYERMLGTGYRRADTFAKMLALLFNASPELAGPLTDRLGAHLLASDADTVGTGDFRHIDRREVHELAAQLVAQTARQGDRVRAAAWADRFSASFAGGWRQEAFARVWLAPGGSPAATAEAVFAGIDSTARSGNSLYMAAVMLTEAGRYDTAAAYLAWAIARDGAAHPVYYLHRARLLLHLGRRDEAHAALLACLREGRDPARAEEARRLLRESGYAGGLEGAASNPDLE